MSTTKLADEIRAFLDESFPGSSIDDGYYFVNIKAPVSRGVVHEQSQRIVDRICAGTCWVIAVGLDLPSHVRARAIEQRSVTYNPDWNVQKEMLQWLVVMDDGKLDLAKALEGADLTGTLVFVNQSSGMVFNAYLRRLYGLSQSAMDVFANGIESSFEADEAR